MEAANLQLLDFLVFGAGVAFTLIGWVVFWRPLAVAHLRQDLFDARDYLFDLVVDRDTTLTFESVAYKGIRSELNSMIRNAGSLSLFGALMIRIFVPEGQKRYAEKNLKLRAALPDDQKKTLQMIDRLQSGAVIKFLMFSSPIMWGAVSFGALFLAIFACGYVVKGGWTAFNQMLEEQIFGRVTKLIELQNRQKYLFGGTYCVG